MMSLEFGPIEKTNQSGATAVPPSVTLLISLFLILITFFIVINSSNKRDDTKKDVAIKSISTQFGKPEEEAINFGGIAKPKVDDYALQIETLFEGMAKIDSTVSGDQINISADKSFFYFADETSLKQDKLELMTKLQGILLKWNRQANIKMTLTLGLENFERDKQRLIGFKRVMPLPNVDVGLDPNNSDLFKLVVQYE